MSEPTVKIQIRLFQCLILKLFHFRTIKVIIFGVPIFRFFFIILFIYNINSLTIIPDDKHHV